LTQPAVITNKRTTTFEDVGGQTPQEDAAHAAAVARRRGAVVRRILVTSAGGANGNGYGAILGFGPEGEFTGPFGSDPRIADPRGLTVDPSGAHIYVNSGDDRVLALDLMGTSCVTRADAGAGPRRRRVRARWPLIPHHAPPADDRCDAYGP
jgi:DNA-binding beta-propeller fold protein YncE